MMVNESEYIEIDLKHLNNNPDKLRFLSVLTHDEQS